MRLRRSGDDAVDGLDGPGESHVDVDGPTIRGPREGCIELLDGLVGPILLLAGEGHLENDLGLRCGRLSCRAGRGIAGCRRRGLLAVAARATDREDCE